MATELTVPTLGMDMHEATVVRWLVSEGERVEKGDPVLEIDTDKTSFEVEAPETGRIANLTGEEGETLEVGTPIAYILEDGEEAPEQPAPGASVSPEPEKTEPASPQAEAPEPMAPEPDAVSDSFVSDSSVSDSLMEAGPSENGRRGRVSGKGLRASPAARRLALDRGVELSEVAGSGPDGRVYLSDVQNFEPDTERQAEKGSALSEEAPAPAEALAGVTPASEDAGTRREPLTQVRRIGAQRTQQSFSEVPHFYLRRDMDVEGLVSLRGRLKERMDPTPSLNDLVAFAVARTLPSHPRLNARYDDGDLLIHKSVNLGIATATEKGLLVPVLKGAQKLRLSELAATVRVLLEGARDGRLSRDELSGGTFTVSNLGMLGVDSFDAIINQPEAAILAIGSMRTTPLWDGDAWIPRRTVSMTLSVDHRVADGADGARFLSDLADGLANWELLM